MTELTIDPALWVGETLEDRLRRYFVDIWTTEGFKQFILQRRERVPDAEILAWRRKYDRHGNPVLGISLRWRGRERFWRFPVVSVFTAPDDGRRFLVFDAVLRRIDLDVGIAVHDEMFEALQAVHAAA